MAHRPIDLYPANVAAASSEYPAGKARNVVTPGDGTATPFDQQWLNDHWAFFQKLMAASGTSYNSQPDTVLNSQYFNALGTLFSSRASTLTQAISLASSGRVTVGDTIMTEGYSAQGDGGGNIYQLKDAGSSGARPAQDGWNSIHVTGGSGGLYLSALTSLNSTVTVQTSGGNYPTLDDALSGEEKRFVSRRNVLTIQIGEGVFESSTPIDLEHNYGIRALIVGQPLEVSTFVSLVSVTSNGAADHDVVWEVADASTYTVGGLVTINGLVGTGQYKVLEGCLPVIDVDLFNNYITVKTKARIASIGALTVAAAVIKRHRTILKFNGSGGFLCRGTIGEGSSLQTGMKQVGLLSDGVGSHNAITVEYNGHLDLLGDVGISSFGRYGIYSFYNSSAGALGVDISNCGSNAMYALNGGVIQAVNAVATGNGGTGAASSVGGKFAASGLNSSGNVSGYLCSGASAFVAEGARFDCNSSFVGRNDASYVNIKDSSAISLTTYGVRTRFLGYTDADGLDVSGSLTYDIYSEFGGQCNVINATYGTISPPVGTEGNKGAMNTVDLLATSGSSFEGKKTFLGTVELEGNLEFPAGAAISNYRSATAAYNFVSVPAHSELTFNITVSGITDGFADTVQLGYNGGNVPGVTFDANVSGTNTVTVRAMNFTAAPVAVSNRTFRVGIFNHA